MVLEHLFPEDWLEKKILYSFLIAIIYTTIAIIAAKLIFARNSGIVSVIFISILLIPYLKKLMKKEEEKEKKEKKFSLKHLWKDNKDAIKVYFSVFFAIFIVYALYSFFLPQFGADTSQIFGEQLHPESSMKGHFFFVAPTFLEIFFNNWWVLLVCFLMSLIAGEGSSFFVVWNASAWGAIFGWRAYASGFVTTTPGILNLLIILGITLPHFILEGGAYILAAISGNVISDEIIEKGKQLHRFVAILFIGGVLYGLLLYAITPYARGSFLFGIINIIIIMILVYFISNLFRDKEHREVFKYNYYLFIIAVILFIVGALVETLILSNSILLNQIYSAASFAHT